MPASLSRFERDLIPRLETADVFACLDHYAAGLVPQHEGRLHNVTADRAAFVIMQVGPAYSHVFQLNEHFVVLRFGDGAAFVADLADARHDGDFHIFHVYFLSDRGVPPVSVQHDTLYILHAFHLISANVEGLFPVIRFHHVVCDAGYPRRGAAFAPVSESSTASASPADTPHNASARRYTSGAGFAARTSSPHDMAQKYFSSPVVLSTHST